MNVDHMPQQKTEMSGDGRDWVNSILYGDSRDVLKKLPDESVNCIVTSPPYYSQRDYNTITQIGSEDSSDEYVQNLESIFTECYRVLTANGTLWLNLGDKYDQSGLLGMP